MGYKVNKFFLVVLLLYLAAVLFCCFHDFGSVNVEIKELFGYPLDKVVHFAMFFPFPVFCYLAFGWHVRKAFPATLLVMVFFVIGVIIAAGTEEGQTFTTYRTGDIHDLKADIVALAMSSAIVWAIKMASIIIRLIFSKTCPRKQR